MTQIGAVSGVSAAPPRRAAARNVLRSFLFADLLALSLSALLSVGLALQVGDGSGLRSHLSVSAALCAALLLWFRSRGHYRARHALSNMLRPVLMGSLLAFLAASTVHVTMDETRLSMATYAFWLSAPAFVLGLRWFTRSMLRAAREWHEPVTLLSAPSIAGDRAHVLARNDDHGLKVVQSLDLSSFAALDDDALAARLDALAGRTLFLAPDEDTQRIANRIVARLGARGWAFYYQPCMGPAPTQNVDILDYPPTEGFVFQIGDSLDRPLARRFKRVFDVAASSVALIVLSPLFALFSWLIRRDGGPALFRQTRVGRGGETFECLKFRTMVTDAEERLARMLASDPERAAEWETYQKLAEDPRITPVGRFLRRTSLDELPQLINVLKGEMSLVGPRPMTVEQKQAYGARLESYVRMRPGLTGMWQVNGRNATSFEERARLDDWYARNWSLWRDAVILARTVREVLFSTGR